MKSHLWCATLIVSLANFTLAASARDVVLPAGTLLKCTLNEPNFSSATAAVGDPVLCHLHGQVEFGQQAFPRGSYLVGHLEDAKDPGHFVGKGFLQLRFDRLGVPAGDIPLEAKVVATNGYKVDKEGKIDGKGHARRDVVEWMLPPLWPWKVIMLPARGPRPRLKGESMITLRLMDDVDIPQVAQTFGPNWHFFGHPRNESYEYSQANSGRPQLAVRGDISANASLEASYATYISREPKPAAREVAAHEVALPSITGLAALPGMPVFVLTTGNVLSVSGYGYQDNRITYSLVGGGSGVITSDQVDWSATTRLNAQRGVRLTLHNPHPGAAVPGL